MSVIATIMLPFVGLLAAGYGTGRYLRIPADGAAGLNAFVYYFALPALFFEFLAEVPFRQLTDWSFVLTTTFATYCAFAIAFSFGALTNRGNIPEATIEGLVGSNANIAYLAPALTIAAFGPAAAGPLALVFTFDSIMLFALVPLMMALGGTARADMAGMAAAIGRRVVLHPLILASLAGFLASAVGLRLPEPLASLLAFLRSAAAPCALFATGLVLAQRKPTRITLDVPVVVLVKLVVHPLIVYLLLSWIGGFDRIWVYSAVLMAALPPAANAFEVARRYQSHVAQSSNAVILGTFASVVTVTAILALLLDETVPLNPFF